MAGMVGSSVSPTDAETVTTTDLRVDVPQGDGQGEDGVGGHRDAANLRRQNGRDIAEAPEINVEQDDGHVGVEQPIALSMDDFQTPIKSRKRPHVSAEATINDVTDKEKEQNSCPICSDFWTATGKHCLCCLPCGHLYGRSCIETWIAECNNKGTKKKPPVCPICRTEFARKDICNIIPPETILFAVDNSPMERMKRKEAEALEQTKQAMAMTARANMENQRLKARLKEMEDLLWDRNEKIRALEARSGLAAPLAPPGGAAEGQAIPREQPRGEFKWCAAKAVTEDGSARVMTYHPREDIYLVSANVPAHLQIMARQKFGFQKVSSLEALSAAKMLYVGVHDGTIRDIKLSRNGEYVLTASLDKTAKITSYDRNTIIHSFDLGEPCWSCAWDATDDNYFYVGYAAFVATTMPTTAKGIVNVYDIRMTGGPVSDLKDISDQKVGIHSLVPIPPATCHISPGEEGWDATPRGLGGVLMVGLKSATFYERKTETDIRPIGIALPDGQCKWAGAAPNSRRFVLTQRHHGSSALRHIVYDMGTEEALSGQKIAMAGDPVQLTRGHVFMRPAASGNHDAFNQWLAFGSSLLGPKGVKVPCTSIWDLDTGELVQNIAMPTADPVLDLCSARRGQQLRLATLTSKMLTIYKWEPT